MGGYVGTTKKDIEYLIDSVSKPGVSVKREIRIKPLHTTTGGAGILYHFYRNGDRLFSVCILPKGNSLSNDFYQWSNLEASILREAISSDVVCKGDDGFREMRVLCQIAEKMYETQNAVKKLKKKQAQLNVQVNSEIGSRKK